MFTEKLFVVDMIIVLVVYGHMLFFKMFPFEWVSEWVSELLQIFMFKDLVSCID